VADCVVLVVGYVADADAFAAASDHVVLEVCDVVDADTVVISVIRADEGNAVVATVAAGGAASLKAIDGLRSTSASCGSPRLPQRRPRAARCGRRGRRGLGCRRRRVALPVEVETVRVLLVVADVA